MGVYMYTIHYTYVCMCTAAALRYGISVQFQSLPSVQLSVRVDLSIFTRVTVLIVIRVQAVYLSGYATCTNIIVVKVLYVHMYVYVKHSYE